MAENEKQKKGRPTRLHPAGLLAEFVKVCETTDFDRVQFERLTPTLRLALRDIARMKLSHDQLYTAATRMSSLRAGLNYSADQIVEFIKHALTASTSARLDAVDSESAQESAKNPAGKIKDDQSQRHHRKDQLQDAGDEASKEPFAPIVLEEKAADVLPDSIPDQHEAGDVDDADLDPDAAQKDAAAHEENRTPNHAGHRPKHDWGQ
jgi:hypothetical protein